MKRNSLFSKVAIGLLILTCCLLLNCGAKKTGSIRKCGRQPGCRKGKVCVKTGSTFSCKRKVIRPVQHEGEVSEEKNEQTPWATSKAGTAGGGGCPESDPEEPSPIISLLEYYKGSFDQEKVKEVKLSSYPALADNTKASFGSTVSQLQDYLKMVVNLDKKDDALKAVGECNPFDDDVACPKEAQKALVECLDGKFKDIFQE